MPLGVKMPPNMDLMGWLKRFAKERGIEVEYIDCRTLTDNNTARNFMMALPDHPGTMVLIDRPDCLPESEYRPQIASMLVDGWKNERMDFSSRDGRYVIVRRSDFITFITIGKDGTFPQGWTQNWAIPFMDWEEVGKPL